MFPWVLPNYCLGPLYPLDFFLRKDPWAECGVGEVEALQEAAVWVEAYVDVAGSLSLPWKRNQVLPPLKLGRSGQVPNKKVSKFQLQQKNKHQFCRGRKTVSFRGYELYNRHKYQSLYPFRYCIFGVGHAPDNCSDVERDMRQCVIRIGVLGAHGASNENESVKIQIVVHKREDV